MTADKERCLRGVALEDFTHHPHARILAVQCVLEISNEASGNILNRVLANAIDARHADPPERILNLVTRDFRLILVHVGHIVTEPTVEGITYLLLVGIRR